MPVYTQAELLSQLSKLYRGKHTPPTQLLANIIDSMFAPVPASIPVGFVGAWFTNVEPAGWIFLLGPDISRTTYAALFAAWGTAFGVGDGTTTFGRPGSIDAYLSEAGPSGTIGTVVGANTKNISHTHGAGTLQVTVPPTAGLGVGLGKAGDDGTYAISGSTGTGGNAAQDFRPKSVPCRWIVKY